MPDGNEFERMLEEAKKFCDLFIQRLQDKIYEVNPEIMLTQYLTSDGKRTRVLADCLADAILHYQKLREVTIAPVLQQQTTEDCRNWIVRAFTSGAIRTGDGLVGQLRECQEENARLKKDNEILTARNQELEETLGTYR